MTWLSPIIPVNRLSGHRLRKRRNLCAREQGGLCYYCKCVMTPVKVKGDGLPKKTSLTLEHIIPLAHGGTNRRENCAAACYQCNNVKHNARLENGA